MRRALLLLGAVIAAAAFQIGTPTVAAPAEVRPAAGEHRAVVVVDTGDGHPKTACVVFTEPSITGLDALRTAQMDPVVQSYSGQGGAVCKLCGVGCSAGSGCLTCQSPKYWQYWRSVGGTGSWSYSNAGAGTTEVRDGDVEGWNWSETKSGPPYYSVESVCADASRTYRYQASSSPTTAPPTTEAPASTTTAAGAAPAPATSAPAAAASGGAPGSPLAAKPASGGAVAPTTSAPTAVAGDVSSTTVTGDSVATPTSEAAPNGAGGNARGDELAAPRRARVPASERSTSPLTYVVFVALLGGIIGWTLRVRRARAKTATSA